MLKGHKTEIRSKRKKNLFSVTMNSDFIKLTGNEDKHKISNEFEFRSYLTLNGEKNYVSSFSQSPLIGSLSNLQVMRTGIKSNEFEFGLDRIIHFGVIRP